MVNSMMQPWINVLLLPRIVLVALVVAFVMVPVLHVDVLASATAASRKLDDDMKCTTCPNSCGTPCPTIPSPPPPEYAYPPPPSPEPPVWPYPPPPEYAYPPTPSPEPPVWPYPPPPYTPRPSSPYCPPPPPSGPECFACGIVPNPPGQLYPEDKNFLPNGTPGRRGCSRWWLALVVGGGLVALWF